MDTEDYPAQLRARVLVVDDSKLMRLAAARALSAEFEVLTAVDGADGWHQIQADAQLQLVLSDLSMPGMGGFELLERVRAAHDARIRNLPMIILTGEEDDDVARQKALALGATDFLAKPFDRIDLLARARAHATSVQATRALQARAEQLSAQSRIDAVTGVGNATAFVERLKQDCSYSRRHRQDLSLLCIEIDHWTQLRAEHGADFGDDVLRKAADVLRGQMRCEDGIARIEAGQFAITLPTANPIGARHLAVRVQRQIAALRLFAGAVAVKFTATIAISTFDPSRATPAAELLRELRMLVQHALSLGGNRVVCERDVGAALASTAAPALGVDEALALIAAGQAEQVRLQMGSLLSKLLPLLRLTDQRERRWLDARIGVPAKPEESEH